MSTLKTIQGKELLGLIDHCRPAMGDSKHLRGLFVHGGWCEKHQKQHEGTEIVASDSFRFHYGSIVGLDLGVGGFLAADDALVVASVLRRGGEIRAGAVDGKLRVEASGCGNPASCSVALASRNQPDFGPALRMDSLVRVRAWSIPFELTGGSPDLVYRIGPAALSGRYFSEAILALGTEEIDVAIPSTWNQPVTLWTPDHLRAATIMPLEVAKA